MISNKNTSSLTANERKAVFSLAGIFSLRMFGLFMLLPVLAIYTHSLEGSTPFLTGLALGAYGLTQALLQIPFGILSDRFDRKKVISIGLLVFAAGSLVAGWSDSIEGLIIGRAIQGAGAVSAAILALTSDLTRSSQRTKAMALIGISIGFTFMLSLVIAPLLQVSMGVDGIFFVVSLLAVLAIVVLYRWVPNAQRTIKIENSLSPGKQLFEAVTNPRLGQLNLGILVSHMLLICLFLVVPGIFVEQGGYALEQHWKLYIPVLLLSVLGMAPLVKGASYPHWILISFRSAVAIMGCGFALLFVGLSYSVSFYWFVAGLIVFFAGFNALEAILPSLASQQVASRNRGTTMALYNTFQFSGVFLGGVLGGLILENFQIAGVFIFAVAATLCWLVLTVVLPKFGVTRSISVDLSEHNISRRGELIDRISALNGIKDVSIVSGETVAYLEVDDVLYDDAELQQLIRT